MYNEKTPNKSTLQIDLYSQFNSSRPYKEKMAKQKTNQKFKVRIPLKEKLARQIQRKW